MKKYQEYMLNFSMSKLKNYLGEKMMETLVEWSPNGEMLLTKTRLITMIDSLYGTNIFKNREFRKDLLLSMKKADILLIRDSCLLKEEKNEKDLIKIIDLIVQKTWGKNKTTRFLLDMWGVADDVFTTDAVESNVSNVIHASGERFFELLDYQYYIKQRALFNLNSGNEQEKIFIHMPTGTGKTKTSMHIIANYMLFSLKKEGLVIWVAHTNELLQQAYDTFVNVWSHLGDGECTAYKIWGTNDIDNVDEPLNGIAFCGLSKLMSIYDGNPQLMQRLKKDCRLLVFDEAHKAGAEKTRMIIDYLMRMPEGYVNRALIGLSATPGRTTEASYNNSNLSNMFGNKLISIDAETINQINMGRLQALNTVAEENIIRYFQERKILSKITAEKLEYQTEFSEADIEILSRELEDLGFGEKGFSKEQLRVFAENKDRNKVIMEKLRKLYNEHIPTIVFACSVPHAKMLSAMLTLEGIENSLVVGEMSPADRKKAIEDFKDKSNPTNIIINYEVLTTGFDSKNIRCVFITRPTQSVVLYSQMLGRGLRGPMMGGNEECLLVDIEDNLESFDNESAFTHFNNYWRI